MLVIRSVLTVMAAVIHDDHISKGVGSFAHDTVAETAVETSHEVCHYPATYV